ncbi:MAG: SGNH/GDSL hydrolase family protein [Chloroflexi bacterium]|nr:SGNH/GDSL hydrolase family protein [Chloroflexota bacterium]
MRTPHRAAGLIALLALAIAAACDGGGSDATPAPAVPLFRIVAGGAYLALGDSIAAGEGSTSPKTLSYPALVQAALEARLGVPFELESLAVPGHTTQDLIDQQLAPAIERLPGSEVRLITITIAGNDLFQYSTEPSCVRDPSDPECPLEAGLLEVERRLDRILGDLRAAAPQAAIVIQLYPNLLSGTGNQFERPMDIAFDLLNGVITGVARRYDVLLADPRVAFLGRGPEFSHAAEPTPDFHPTDAGHRAIADAFLAALGVELGDERKE